MSTTMPLPQEVTNLDLAFGARALDLMPPMSEIPAEFKNHRNTWVKLQSDWLFHGLDKSATFQPRDGIDGACALRHLAVIQNSFEPKHEHKEAAVAYLASLWFVRVTTPDKTYGEAVA